MNEPQTKEEKPRPPMLGGNMVFFSHSLHLVKNHQFEGVYFHHLKPNYGITLAYTFPNDNVCIAAASILQPQDKYIRKMGNEQALERLTEAYKLVIEGDSEVLPKHTAIITSSDVVAYCGNDLGYFLAGNFSPKASKEVSHRLAAFLESIPLKMYSHSNVQAALLSFLVETDMATFHAFAKPRRFLKDKFVGLVEG